MNDQDQYLTPWGEDQAELERVAIAAQKLTYAMETLGLPMPEGYRFRVTVEKSNG